MALNFGGEYERDERDDDMREREIEEERLADLEIEPLDLPHFQTDDPQTPGSNANYCCRELSIKIKNIPKQYFIIRAKAIILRAFTECGYRESAFGYTDNDDGQPAFWQCLTPVNDESDKKHLSDFIVKTLKENPKYKY